MNHVLSTNAEVVIETAQTRERQAYCKSHQGCIVG